MTSSEQVREEIARVLFDAIDLNRAVLADCELIADAILARWPVLAGPTDEMVEAGARAVDPAAWEESQWQAGGRAGALPESASARDARIEARGLARAVLTAVLGASQGPRDADAPGDGSTS